MDAVADWNGKDNTEYLKAVGLNKKIILSDDEYIPSLGGMYLIYLNRRAINQALEAIGGDPIKDYWYWTSTACSQNLNWNIFLGTGKTDYEFKVSFMAFVRLVSTFIS